jgi:hypothetical protein
MPFFLFNCIKLSLLAVRNFNITIQMQSDKSDYFYPADLYCQNEDLLHGLVPCSLIVGVFGDTGLGVNAG